MMKHTLTAAALAVVLASPAFAQSTAPSNTMQKPDMNKSDTMTKPDASVSPGTTTPSTSAQSSTMANDQVAFVQTQNSTDWRGSNLIGATVYGPDNASIGDINDVLIANDGKINAVVIGVGGFLGVGEKTVAIPFDKLTVARKADSASIEKITVAYTKDELKNAPKFAYYDPTPARATTTGAGTGADRKPMNPMGEKAK
jgi:hypothetical protein